MYFNRKEPELCYSGPEDYIIKNYGTCSKPDFLNKNPYPCVCCRGHGTIWDPNDPPCPIEGNKLRNRIKCQHCGGSGKGTRKEILSEYNKWLKDYKKRHREWVSDMKKWNKIQDWIDKHPKWEVREILSVYGVYR